jgi:carbonic anhydrase/acetyltransferase-like protein (isoleucine patch superfamily)
MNNFVEYQGKRPTIGHNVFLAPGTQLVGDVRIGDDSSIWFNCVLRGDIQPVIIGHHTNIQDGTVCHVGYKEACVVGNYVTCGHNAIIHGCTIGDEVLVGMGATLMNGVVVGDQSIIGAAALLTEGMQVPPGSLVYGSPAKVISHLGEKERLHLKSLAEEYCGFAANYRQPSRQP